MQNNFIYALTPRGEQELRGGITKLSAAEVEILVRIDGFLNYGQIQASMPGMSAETFLTTISGLVDKRLLTLAGAEADSGSVSLRKTGYYVSIARKRDPVRTLVEGDVLTAIVVDDEPVLAKFIESYLAFEGFKVRMAGNRAEVINELRSTPIPDLILLDVMLPDVDGFDILLRVRQHPALKNVPIIMLTGKASREDVLKGLAGGADGYVTKPFEADVLMRAVRTVIGLPEA